MGHERELEVALHAAEQASSYILREYHQFEVIPDAPAHISTQVDRDSQEFILQHLHAAFPDDSLLAEEATDTLNVAPAGRSRVWVVDPIDGTRGFARKSGDFSVMIALVENSELALGVVIEPVRHRVTYATRGDGCWYRVGTEPPNRAYVSQVRDPRQSRLTQSRSKPDRPPTPGVQRVQPKEVIETYSAGVKLAMVARGEVEMYLNSVGFRDWDLCAGQLLVEEAGGRVTDLEGNPFQFHSLGSDPHPGLLASNGVIHDAVLACWQQEPTS